MSRDRFAGPIERRAAVVDAFFPSGSPQFSCRLFVYFNATKNAFKEMFLYFGIFFFLSSFYLTKNPFVSRLRERWSCDHEKFAYNQPAIAPRTKTKIHPLLY